MKDMSYLDRKYFIDKFVYNCPFCNRRNVEYTVVQVGEFNWSETKTCFIYLARCSSCTKVSMHLSHENIVEKEQTYPGSGQFFALFNVDDIDSNLFYSVPTSFFVIDSRIPAIIRELITEADGCQKMNYLTGASACARKAIYELLLIEKAEGRDYEDKIKFLKHKYTSIDPELFDILAAVQDMTSDKIHEQSWDMWDSDNLKLIIETLKTILYEIYVTPKIKKERLDTVRQLREKIIKEKK